MKAKLKLVRDQFPILKQRVNGRKLVYLDNAATTQTPRAVLDAVREYKEFFNANPRRGAHYLGGQATILLERARRKVQHFLNAPSPEEIIFTRNATEALNLIAYSFGLSKIEAKDEIVLCISEHHSNLVPWQRIARLKGAALRYLYLNDDYTLNWEEVKNKITARTALVGIAHMSNVLGTIYPIKELVGFAHKQGAAVVVDGVQSVPHQPVDVQDLNADFFVFSGHKVFGPMGIGVLYGKRRFLEAMPPFLMGGEMVEYVQEQEAAFSELPYKFEAGTPNLEGAVGLEAALNFVEEVGWDFVQKQERQLLAYALETLQKIPYLSVYGPKCLKQQGPVLSFTIKDCHPHDVATIADAEGIALRSGHHCAQPLMNYLGVPATSRASFSFYNTKEEIRRLAASLSKVRKWLGYGS
ncbi:MAG: cysteine desulfurase [Firmicutes bacterium]|nr:cysteine desulfurase [Bacillota bacterium]